MNHEPAASPIPQCTLDDYETRYADRHLLHAAIDKWARETPEQLAVIDADTGRQYTYRQMAAITTALALQLVELGLRPGDFLATSLPLLPEHIFLEYACFRVGVIHAPLDLRLKAAEVVRSLEMIHPAAYAFLGRTPHADFGELGRVVQAQCPEVRHFIQFAPPGETIEGATSAAVLSAEAEELGRAFAADPAAERFADYRAAVAAVEPGSGAQVIYTTGSTGLPKPALLSHRNITCQNMCLAAGFDLGGTSRMLVNLPPSHVGCQGEQLMTTFFAGGTAVVLHMFDAEKSLAAIERYQVDAFGQIPAMFELQWRLPNYEQFDLSSLRMALFGGQQVTRPFLERLARMVPRIGTGLGLSEMAGFVTYSGLTDQIDHLLQGVGWPMPVTPLSIRAPMTADGRAGAELPAGEVGEICFSGPQVFIDYVNCPEAYRRTVSVDGYCYTGDLGRQTPRGLEFVGRLKLVIKPKGYQVHPAQVEEHFCGLTDEVAACAAVGAPHDVFSEGIVLFVETKPGKAISRERLEQHAGGIAAYMRPLHYVLFEPGGLPLNRVAKTDYLQLGQRAHAEVDALRARGGWDR